MDKYDEDAFVAAVTLIGHTGAKEFEIGYLHPDVPIQKAAWWAKAQYQGARIMVEQHISPVDAAEALAERILTGGKCTWCEGLIALNSEDAKGQCLWRRIGRRWEPGCIHGHSTAPKAPKDRAARRRLAREFEATRHKEK